MKNGTRKKTKLNIMLQPNGLWYNPDKVESYFIEVPNPMGSFVQSAQAQMDIAFVKMLADLNKEMFNGES